MVKRKYLASFKSHNDACFLSIEWGTLQSTTALILPKQMKQWIWSVPMVLGEVYDIYTRKLTKVFVKGVVIWSAIRRTFLSKLTRVNNK